MPADRVSGRRDATSAPTTAKHANAERDAAASVLAPPDDRRPPRAPAGERDAERRAASRPAARFIARSCSHSDTCAGCTVSRDDAAQVGAERLEVDLVAQPGAERLERPRRVVAAAVEAAVDRRLDARARRPEQRRDRQRRGRDREVRLARPPAPSSSTSPR